LIKYICSINLKKGDDPMPRGQRGTKRQIIDKVQLLIYEDEAELWEGMQQITTQSTKSGLVWELAKLGAVHAAEHHEQQLKKVTETCERIGELMRGAAAPQTGNSEDEDAEIPKAFDRRNKKEKTTEKTS
jgi:hypothetical protein